MSFRGGRWMKVDIVMFGLSTTKSTQTGIVAHNSNHGLAFSWMVSKRLCDNVKAFKV